MRSILFSTFFFIGSMSLAATSCPEDKSARCDEMYSCAAMYTCQLTELNKLNAHIAQAITEAQLDSLESCQKARNVLEDLILAHSTTIECVDTESGKIVGG